MRMQMPDKDNVVETIKVVSDSEFGKLLDEAFNSSSTTPPSNIKSSLDNDIPSIPLPEKIKISPRYSGKIQIADLDEADVNTYLDLDEKGRQKELQKELFRNIQFIDEQISDIEVKTRSYDKFSKSIFESKIALVDQRLKHLEALSKMNKEQTSEKRDMEAIRDITELLGNK